MDITKNFPVFTQSKHMILRKDQIYAICVYDTKEYENIVYNSVNDVFYKIFVKLYLIILCQVVFTLINYRITK